MDFSVSIFIHSSVFSFGIQCAGGGLYWILFKDTPGHSSEVINSGIQGSSAPI